MSTARTNAEFVLPELKRRKTTLLSQCRKIVSKLSRPLNIAVVGPPGWGKSAFLNTVFASFKDGGDAHWREIAREGNYGRLGIQVTQTLRSFHTFDYLDVDDKKHMPTFVDMTGFEDTYSERNTELFKIVLDGKLQNGESLNSVIANLPHGRNQYYQRSSNLVIDCIIVVCTLDVNAPLPLQLLRTIRETATPRGVSIFGVLTHADKVKPGRDFITLRQERFKTHLGLIGTRFITITNYCEDYDPSKSYISSTIPNLDIPVLQLMTQVLQHEQHESTERYLKGFIMLVSVLILILAILVVYLYSPT